MLSQRQEVQISPMPLFWYLCLMVSRLSSFILFHSPLKFHHTVSRKETAEATLPPGRAVFSLLVMHNLCHYPYSGWKKELRPRSSGNRVDPIYISPTGRKLLSYVQVLRYLEAEAKGIPYVHQKRKRIGSAPSIASPTTGTTSLTDNTITGIDSASQLHVVVSTSPPQATPTYEPPIAQVSTPDVGTVIPPLKLQPPFNGNRMAHCHTLSPRTTSTGKNNSTD